jgi:hypothetical protein
MKKPTKKPVKKRPVRRPPARKPARVIEGASKLEIIKMVLEDSSAVASVQIIGDQRTEELLELFQGVHDKWVVALKPSRKGTLRTALMAPGGGGGTVVVMMLKETKVANDI